MNARSTRFEAEVDSAGGGSAAPMRRLLGEAGIASAEKRTHQCARPVRLRGATRLVNPTTGETRIVYASEQELDGFTEVPCGNRREAVCAPCSATYKRDAWGLVVAGLAGGKGIPEAVAAHPCTFATLTAPSFGAVHGVRQKGPCRARRDKPVCPHGRRLWCLKRHRDDDPRLGEPLCVDCYDYTGHVVWQWHAPELWRRFTIALQRDLARRAGVSVARFRELCKISYSKVVEFQHRGLIHVHVPTLSTSSPSTSVCAVASCWACGGPTWTSTRSSSRSPTLCSGSPASCASNRRRHATHGAPSRCRAPAWRRFEPTGSPRPRTVGGRA